MSRWLATAWGLLCAVLLAIVCVTVPASMLAHASTGSGNSARSTSTTGGGGAADDGMIWAGVSYSWGDRIDGSSPCRWSYFRGDSSGGGAPSADFGERRVGGVLYRLFMRVCPTGQRLVWVPQVPPRVIGGWGAAFLARWLPRPTVRLAPPAGRLVVTVPTWFWTDAVLWRPVSVTVSVPTPAGPVWVVTTAVPLRLVLEPGDGLGATVLCAGPGVPWTALLGDEVRSPVGCDYTYLRPSVRARAAGWSGRYSARLSIDWSVTWRSSTGAVGSGGTVRTTSTAPVTVREIEALGVVGGG